MRCVALTTTDNPYDPLDQFAQWFAFDSYKGYYSCSLLDRIARTSKQFTDEENNEEIERAIDEIVHFDTVSYETEGKVHFKKVVHENDEEDS